MLSDVVFNGIHQRLKREDPWKPAAVVLVFWTLLCIIWNTIKPLSPATYAYIFWPLNVVSFAVGCWTILRDQRRLGHASVALLKSALVGASPDLLTGLLWAINVFHPTVLDMHGSPQIHGAGITILSVRTDATISALEFLLQLLLVTPAVGISTTENAFAQANGNSAVLVRTEHGLSRTIANRLLPIGYVTHRASLPRTTPDDFGRVNSDAPLVETSS